MFEFISTNILNVGQIFDVGNDVVVHLRHWRIFIYNFIFRNIYNL
jgi:hypothetical protein